MPLTLEKQGRFYVNMRAVYSAYACGRPASRLGSGQGTIAVEQMYVEYQIPKRKKRRWPIILVHGGGLSGAQWDTTPDGRDGWKTHFLRRGHAVYVVDQVGTGRSGFDPTLVNQAQSEDNAALLSKTGAYGGIFTWTREAAWDRFRFGESVGRAHPDLQFPIEAEHQAAAQAIPSSNFFTTPLSTQGALAGLLEKIGPAILLGFSAGAAPALAAAAARSHLAKAVILIEPSMSHAASDEQLAQLTNLPCLAVYGDYIDGNHFWQPIYDACCSIIGKLAARAGKAEVLSLPQLGIRGNSHLLMQDKNNLQIADLLLDWLKRHHALSEPRTASRARTPAE